MQITEIMQMPDGFTPPDVTVKIKKVYEYKSGSNNEGPWSFQNLEVEGGKLKLKGLPEFPKSREGMTVTLRANHSKQHGLTGLKMAHEEYKGKTYDQLVVTPSAKWEWAGSQNGAGAAPVKQDLSYAPSESVEGYIDHLISVAALSDRITTILGIQDPAAIQACFATLCIDTKNRGVLLPKTLPTFIEKPEPEPASTPFDEPPPFDSEPMEEPPF